MYFNPHSREGSDKYIWYQRWCYGNFNPHSHEGSDSKRSWQINHNADFNPHSREGSDGIDIVRIIWCEAISIHTPAKGVTYQPFLQDKGFLFQSTLPRREWRSKHGKHGKDTDNFNPHSREGSDYAPCYQITFAKNFNPHSREGSDLSMNYHHRCHTNFNPHSREGSDSYTFWQAVKHPCISIHTPAKGVTTCLHCLLLPLIFQSTLPQREWPNFWKSTKMTKWFQSTLPRREWRIYCNFFVMI